MIERPRAERTVSRFGRRQNLFEVAPGVWQRPGVPAEEIPGSPERERLILAAQARCIAVGLAPPGERVPGSEIKRYRAAGRDCRQAGSDRRVVTNRGEVFPTATDAARKLGVSVGVIFHTLDLHRKKRLRNRLWWRWCEAPKEVIEYAENKAKENQSGVSAVAP